MQDANIPKHVPPELVRNFNIFEFITPSQDVHQAWRKLIDDEPDVFYTTAFGGFWVITSGELLEKAFLDPELFCSGKSVGIPPTPPELPPFLPIDSDDPFHAAIRRPLNMALSPKSVQALSMQARELATLLVAEIAPRGRCDFVNEFSLKMPMQLFLNIVDLPLDDREYLLGIAHQGLRNPDPKRRREAHTEMHAYLDSWVRKRAEHPGDDFMSKVVTLEVDGKPLSHEERIGYMTTVMFGGLDTVGGMMAMSARHLAEHPEHRRQLVAHPEGIPDAIEEILRRYGIPTVGRYVTRDVEFGGIQLKEGDRIMLPTMVHGLDERRWPDAMTVKLDRHPHDHLAFGKGTHRCPGANLARAELRIFLEEWLKRIPDFSIDPKGQLQFESGSVAGLKTLPLVWPKPQ